MGIPFWFRQFVDGLVGFHDDCICQYADYVDWYEGKITAIFVGDVEYVPRDSV